MIARRGLLAAGLLAAIAIALDPASVYDNRFVAAARQ
jgi:hypothetical protein